MSSNDPMTKEQLDAIQARADSVTTLRRAMPGDWQRLALHLSEDVDTLIAEVERLRALTTVDEDMVERAARAYFEYEKPGEFAAHPMSWEQLTTTCPSIADTYRDRLRAVLDAALNPGEGS